METNDEQVEILKKWWQDNGRAVLAGIIIGVGGLFGYRMWVDYNESRAEAASVYFEQMAEALQSDDPASASQSAETLVNEYSDTEYLVLAKLALARIYVETEEYKKAQQALEQVVETVGFDPVGYLARQRLAAVQLQIKQLEQALVTLSVDFPKEFSAGVEELKGDIYAAQGDTAKAVQAYRKAQQGSPGAANSEFLQQKIDDLGTA